MNRTQIIKRLREETFDVCIIGGGASGAGAALDAALRGMKVALIEADDFASGTSSRSTKLIHGGVRYLEQAFKQLDFAQLKQVKHGLEERHIVLSNAPHLARPLALITPVFNRWEGWYYALGLKLYALFASKRDTLPGSRWLSRKAAWRHIPTLTRRMYGAVLYYDGQLDDARYALALAQSAGTQGAAVINHTVLTGFEVSDTGRIEKAWLKNQLIPDEPAIALRAKVFLNCTGPGADKIRLMANPNALRRIRQSKGVHAVLPSSVLNSTDALLIPKTPDGRVVFAVPFQDKLLLGTTDDEYVTPDQEPVLERKEVEYLLNTLRPYLDTPVHADLVEAGFGGLRPLIQSVGKATKGLLRDHEVELDEVSGLISLMGGKWTTYRLMAKDAVDAVAKRLGNAQPCQTDDFLLDGAMVYSEAILKAWERQSGLDEQMIRHLYHNYGKNVPKVLALLAADASLGERLADGYPFIKAEVCYAAEEEMCCSVRDFVARRIRLEIGSWPAAEKAAPEVARLLGKTLHWSKEKIEAESDQYQQLMQFFMRQIR